MILLDTSGLLAALDSSQRRHSAAAASLTAAEPPLLLSPFVLAELDHLASARLDAGARRSLLEEVERGAYRLEPFSGSDVEWARREIERHPELELTLADASIVVLANRHAIHEVLTLDERRFRALTTSRGQRFRLLPADA